MLQLFSGKRVLVTGDTGFKGSWLALWLHELGADVSGLALPPQTPDDHFVVTGLGEVIRHFDGDVRDSAFVSRVFAETQPEFVFHLAAQPLVRLSYAEPKATFDTNIAGAVNVLEAVRATPSIRSLVFVTSDKCYLNKEWAWGYRENDELGGRDPYSASKAAAELVFSAYSDSFFAQRSNFGAATVRAGNVIGGGDWSQDRIVPDCIRSLRQHRPILVRNPKATRPWQHVLDPLYGYLLIAAKLHSDPKHFGGAWNFGPESTSMRTVGELVETVIANWGSGAMELVAPKDAPHEARLLHLNCDKAHQQLQWQPLWRFERAVRETVEWYKLTQTREGSRELSCRQIRQFMMERREESGPVAVRTEAAQV